ncbi:LysR substrate-binding domain-containing protein [Roseovarius sp. SYSU LYC5161]|uniref:LysR substrate-binding domain-containing protein n=1 Tax=Roseovarius halophilus (ex Wu et al. 2025) TaxID=3376060 RepID=UPI0039999D38
MARRLPSLNQLRAFEAAARHGSFKRGAAELCVTQAAVSHQVKGLEAALGVQLFHRATRKVWLTQDGQRLLAPLTAALDEIETAVLDATGTRMTGEISLTAAPFYGNRFLMSRLPRFHAAQPGLTVGLSLSFAEEDLAQAGLDGAVRYGAGNWPGLTGWLIHRDRIGPVCAPPLLDGAALPRTPASIAWMPLATTTSWAGEWQEWFAAAGYVPDGPLHLTEYDSRALAFDAALSGNAVCLADIRLTAAAEASGSLRRLHPVVAERPQGIHVVYPAGRRPDPRVAAFADWLRAEAAGVAAEAAL